MGYLYLGTTDKWCWDFREIGTTENRSFLEIDARTITDNSQRVAGDVNPRFHNGISAGKEAGPPHVSSLSKEKDTGLITLWPVRLKPAACL